jgi:hypothetical protein
MLQPQSSRLPITTSNCVAVRAACREDLAAIVASRLAGRRCAARVRISYLVGQQLERQLELIE